MSLPGDPFALGRGPDACLLLHGFTGSPYEVRPVGELLARHGFHAIGPRLPGHGRGPQALLEVDRRDLLEFARDELRALRGARRVFICGLSAGALLAVELAATLRLRDGDPDLCALALLAPAVRFLGTSALFADVFGRLPFPRSVTLAKGPRDTALALPGPDPSRPLVPGVDPDGSLTRIPLGWARELHLLSQEAFALAHRVRMPSLILHGARDQTTDPRGARLLADELASPTVELRIFPESGHLLPIDREGAQVCEAVVDFFLRR